MGRRTPPVIVCIDTRTALLSRYIGKHKTHQAQLSHPSDLGISRGTIHAFRAFPDDPAMFETLPPPPPPRAA
jgi:hypothetical protein